MNSQEAIGISDDLTPWVQRINAAVAYVGSNDHEDVRSILRAFDKRGNSGYELVFSKSGFLRLYKDGKPVEARERRVRITLRDEL